jgi:hypothetical protein
MPLIHQLALRIQIVIAAFQIAGGLSDNAVALALIDVDLGRARIA